MPSEVEQHPSYMHTIERLEAVKRLSSQDIAYWMARDINMLLGYPNWREFEAVIERAKNSMAANGIDPSHQIELTHKLMEVGGGARTRSVDYFLSRAACRLIAMNGDPKKPEIAAAQAYFVVQTQRMEKQDALTEDEKRLELRERVKSAAKLVSGVAQEAGVSSRGQGPFHDARYQGLYGMNNRDVVAKKGLRPKSNLLDHAGPLELSANEFQMNMAADAIKKEGVKGEQNVIQKNRKIAQDVRDVMKQSGSTMPEDLPAAEPIKLVEKRLNQQKQLSKPRSTS